MNVYEYEKQTRQGWVCMMVCLLLMAGFLVYGIRQASGRLANQDALDRHGVTTTGPIEGKHITGSKSRLYLIDYQFQLNGTTYNHSSPVIFADYEATQPGQPVTITYLPDRPDICRAQQSIGRSEAEGLQRSLYLSMGLLVLLPFVYKYGRRQGLRRLIS
jgi:hypothetical protein